MTQSGFTTVPATPCHSMRRARVTRRVSICAVLLSAGLVAGCSSSGGDSSGGLFSGSLFGGGSSDDTQGIVAARPATDMFAEADLLLERGRFEAAAKRFEDIDREHPYAVEARRALAMASYAHYRAGKHPEAISAARRYIGLHPGTKEAAFAQYYLAMSYFDQMNDPSRDQSMSIKAKTELETLIRRYPDTKYTQQARNRILIVNDTLAAAEMHRGRYYMERKNFAGAINRFRTVVTDYQTTAQIEEALHRLVESYMALGVVAEAQNAAAVLGHNYPDSKWYRDSFALLQSRGLSPQTSSGSWLTRTLSQAVALVQ